MQKLIEIKGDNWMDGISTHPTGTIDGIFRQASNFNPFERMGVMQPSRQPTTVDNETITTAVELITPVVHDGAPVVYAHTASKLYSVDEASNTVTDITANLDGNTGSPLGGKYWKNKYIFVVGTKIFANTINSTTTTEIYALQNSPTQCPLAIGADGNLYAADGHELVRIVNDAGPENNAVVFEFDSDMTIRDHFSDGRYHVVLLDANPGTHVARFRCQVAFWNYYSGLLTQNYDEPHFQDTYLIGGQVLDDGVYIFGRNNLYVCNVASSPKIITTFLNSNIRPPLSRKPALINRLNNAIIWADANDVIWGYGSLTAKERKIFFTPYSATGSGNINCLQVTGNKVWAGTSDTSNALQEFLSSSTRQTAFIWLADTVLSRPYKYGFSKVVLKEALNNNKAVSLQILSGDDRGAIATQQVKNHTTDSGKFVLLFYPASTTGSYPVIESLSFQLQTNATVQRFEIWGEPLDPQYQL